MKDRELALLLQRGNALHRTLTEALPRFVDGGVDDRGTVAIDAGKVALEHAAAFRMMVAAGIEVSRQPLLRLQVQAVVRGAWALWCASERQAEAVTSSVVCGSPLTSRELPSSLKQQQAVLASERLPDDFRHVLAELPTSFWGAESESSFHNLGYYNAERSFEADADFLRYSVQFSNQVLMLAFKLILIGDGKLELLEAVDRAGLTSQPEVAAAASLH
ncbi:MAG: hypothetical protein J0L58_10565 [Burkholderiales bacterium]|nr:hypothetical protein [Burkholderiales bacterium]